MAQLTLRTLLAYLDDTLEPNAARELGKKVAESDVARELIERIKKVTRRRRLQTPDANGADEDISDPNTVSEYLSNTLDPEQVQRLEQACLDSDVYLAEVAACHQILTVVLAEPVRVPPKARERMYKLIAPPAGSPKRRAPASLPVVGGTAPHPADRAEGDDSDAALLLGMNRFGAGSTALRFGMAAAGVGIAALLAVAVYLALPHAPPDAPPASPPEFVLASPAPAPAPRPVPTPAPKPPEPEPVLKTPEPAPIPTPPAPPPKVKGKEPPTVAPPRADQVEIGTATDAATLLLTRPAADAKWARLDPAGNAVVTANDEVLCLPGYTARVNLRSGVSVLLWGNVPEFLPSRLLDARVRFHAPTAKADGTGFESDADITLLAGRVYLTPTKGEERVRVRAAGEVYDLTLPERSEVAVELVLAYEPGVAFLRTAGPPPRAEVKMAVVRGSATVAAPLRGLAPTKVESPGVLSWTSKTGGRPAGPTPADKAGGYFDKFPLVPSDRGKGVQKALTEVAGRLAPDADRTQVLMAELVTEPAAPGRFFHGLVGIYGLAAVASTADELKPLVDVLTDEGRGYDRTAAVAALAAWLARGPDRTAELGVVLDRKIPGEGVADRALRLLRGTVNPAAPDPGELDRLVADLSHPSVAIRELALWNLLTFVDPSAGRVPGLAAHDVGMATGMPHDRFVRAWAARAEEVKRRPAGKS